MAESNNNKKTIEIDFDMVSELKLLFKDGYGLRESNLTYTTFNKDDAGDIDVFCLRVVSQKGNKKRMYNVFKNSIKQGIMLRNNNRTYYVMETCHVENDDNNDDIKPEYKQLRQLYNDSVEKYQAILKEEVL